MSNLARLIRHCGIFLGFALFAASPAVAKIDPVDVSVEAFAAAAGAGGVHLGETEKTIAKALVRCAADKKPVLTCARDEVIRRLPEEAQPIATCMIGGTRLEICAEREILRRLPVETRTIAACIAKGTPIARCATAEVVNRMPPETQLIARCMTGGGTFESCAADEAIRRLPPDARGIATCIASRTDIGACAGQAGASALQREALTVIEKLKADGRSELGQGAPGPIRNIINVAEGIREKDWPKVILHGGSEVYKLAVKIILNILLTPALKPLIDPIVDVVVQARTDLLADLMRGIETGDAKLIGRAVTEAYLKSYVEIPCALPGIPQDVREAVCGTIGKIIREVGKVGADAVDLAVRLIKDPLGIPDTLWDELEGVRGFLDGKDTDCVKPHEYYSGNYSKCYHRGAYLRIVDTKGFDDFRGTLNHQCRRYYDRCFFSKNFDRLCNPQRDMYATHVDQLVRSLREAAGIYANGFPAMVSAAGARACQRGFDQTEVADFTRQCESALKVQVPLPGDPTQANCGFSNQQFSAASAHYEVCKRAVERVFTPALKSAACNKALSEHRPGASFDPRRPHPVLPPAIETPTTVPIPARPSSPTFRPVRCFDGRIPTSGGACICPPGRFERDGVCRTLSASPPLPTPKRLCPDGSRVDIGIQCPSAKPPVIPVAVVCSDGSRVASRADCRKRCPDGSIVREADACPVSRPPVTPTLFTCADGSRAPSRLLCRKRCPDGAVVREVQACPTPKPAVPAPKRITCPVGYRVLDKPNKYGALCEIISKTGPAPVPQPKPQPKPDNCRWENVCVQWGKGPPGTLAGPCIKTERRRLCGSGPVVK